MDELMHEVWDELSGEEFIARMFERTDAEGILYLPDWALNGTGWEVNLPEAFSDGSSIRCRMRWNLWDMERIAGKFSRMVEAIAAIAPHYSSMYTEEAEIRETLTDPKLLDFYKTYLKPMDTGDMDLQQINDIADRLNTRKDVQKIAAELAKGHALEDYQRDVLLGYVDVTVSRQEQAYYKRYVEMLFREAESRIGAGVCAYRVTMSARRLCALLHLGAPKIVLDNEKRQLAMALTLHAYCGGMEKVSSELRLRMEQLDDMSDEELDACYSLKKSNSRKSLAPLFVYKILEEQTSEERHLRQQEILDILSEFPYEIVLERKAMSRIIHNLADSDLNIRVDKTGVWYQKRD